MATTKNITLSSGGWTEVATGEGLATFTGWGAGGVEWAVAAPGGLTSGIIGHFAPDKRDTHLSLASGESLYVRGRGQIALTADNEVT